MGLITYAFHPFAIGLGYFLPQDLLFSSWFFYFVAKGQAVAASAIGWQWSGDAYFRFAPYLNEQSFGACLGLLAFALWTGRGFLGEVSGAVLRPRSTMVPEPLPYRFAVAGVVLGVAALATFLAVAGMVLIISVEV